MFSNILENFRLWQAFCKNKNIIKKYKYINIFVLYKYIIKSLNCIKVNVKNIGTIPIKPKLKVYTI